MDATRAEKSEAAGLFPGKAAIFADLDGCLVSGAHALPGAVEFAAAAAARLWIVSNNSADTEATLARRLAGLGIMVALERLFLAGAQTLRRLASERPGARVALFAAPPLVALAGTLGLILDAERAEVAVLARDPGFDLAALTRLLGVLHRGAPLIVTNLDGAHPGPDGAPAPETGALLAAVRVARPGTRVRSLGKPAPDLLLFALSRAGAAPGACVFVGDNAATDGRAAAAAGVAFVRVDPALGVAPLMMEAA